MAAQSTTSVQFEATGNPIGYSTGCPAYAAAVAGGYVTQPQQFVPAENQEQVMDTNQTGATRVQRRGKA